MKSGIWMLAMLGVACGSSGSTTAGTAGTGGASGSTSGSTTGASGATSGGASGTGTGTGSGSSSGLTSGTAQHFAGVISLSTTATLDSAVASFFSVASSGTASSCPAPGVLNGACCYSPKPTASSGTTSSGGTTTVGAGTLTVTDGTTTIATMPYDGGYPVLNGYSDPTLAWSAGDSLTVVATGDPAGVGAFTGTVTAPATVTGTTPALSLLTPTPISLASDFTLTWPVGSGSASVILDVEDITSGDSIQCVVSDSGGTVTVPSALLTHLTAGDTCALALSREDTGSFSMTSANANVLLLSLAAGGGACSLQ